MSQKGQSSGRVSSAEQRRAAAEELAIAALGFIAAEPERLGRFPAVTGIDPQSIREAAREPHFLAGVLNHIAADERLLLAFAAESEIDPSDAIPARDALMGGGWGYERTCDDRPIAGAVKRSAAGGPCPGSARDRRHDARDG